MQPSMNPQTWKPTPQTKPTDSLKRLAIDTSFSRYNTQPPEEITVSKLQGQSSNSAGAEERSLLQQKLQFRILDRAGLEQLGFEQPVIRASHETSQQFVTSVPAFHRRIERLRPTPLDLHRGYSSSYRAVPIGTAISPYDIPGSDIVAHAVATAGNEMLSPAAHHGIPHENHTPHYGQEISTPIIVVTPARESFSMTPTPDQNVKDWFTHRPTSSVYSQYTNYIPKSGISDRRADPERSDPALPPVPPIPSNLPSCPIYKNVSTGRGQIVRLPHRSMTGTTNCLPALPEHGFEDHADLHLAISQDSSSPFSDVAQNEKFKSMFSATTIHDDEGEEEDEAGIENTPLLNTSRARPSELRIVTPGLPTPLRSRGWWSVITSPFSARSGTGSFFPARSPSIWLGDGNDDLGYSHHLLKEKSGTVTIARSASSRTVAETTRGLSSPCSAPAVSIGGPNTQGLRRADTAPARLDPNTRPSFNIYRIPSEGEAAAYFDSGRQFPSPQHLENPDAKDDARQAGLPVGWSPSWSVYKPPRIPDEISPILRNIPSSTPKEEFNSPTQPRREELRGKSAITLPVRDRSPVTAYDLVLPKSEHSTIEACATKADEPPTSLHKPLQIQLVDSDSSPKSVSPGTLGRCQTSLSIQSRGLGITNARASICADKPPYSPPSSTHLAGTPDQHRQATLAALERSPIEQLPDSISLKEVKAEDTHKECFFSKFHRIVKQHPRRLIAMFPFVLILAAIGSAITLLAGRHSRDNCRNWWMGTNPATQAYWYNTTGFPGLPIGVSTVVQPHRINEENGCVADSLWTCDVNNNGSVLVTQQQDTTGGMLPNFRFLIMEDGTDFRANETRLINDVNATKSVERVGRANRYFPSPALPGESDRAFMGRTTDNVSRPWAGEKTPFLIYMTDPVNGKDLARAKELAEQKRLKALEKEKAKQEKVKPKSDEDMNQDDEEELGEDKESPHVRRDLHSLILGVATETNASTAAPTKIPNAVLPRHSHGRPLTPNLYPYVKAQPLRLFDRGLDSEHYGFYTYYTRTLTVDPSVMPNMTTEWGGVNLAQEILDVDSYLINFSQTRFRVQIWTRRGPVAGAPLLDAYHTRMNMCAVPKATNSSAVVFDNFGSFPYPVTITIDRHGGDSEGKAVYAYGLDDDGKVMKKYDGHGETRGWIAEDRAAGGPGLVHPADDPESFWAEKTGHPAQRSRRGIRSGAEDESKDTNVDHAQVYGGIDGGTGGCMCQWSSL